MTLISYMTLLQICPIKWQKQYDLNNCSTLLSTRVLLLILDKIETNVEVNKKPLSTMKAKGADAKIKVELINSLTPKKSKWMVYWTKKHCSHCKKPGGMQATHNKHDCNQ